MTWDEFQNLHLKIAREVGAEQDLRAELIELKKLHHASAYRRDLGMTIREILEEAKKWQR